MSTAETIAGFTWLYNTLSGDSQLASLAPGGVWRAMAPPGTATPFVVFAMQSGTDVLTMNAARLMTDNLFQVKAVGPAKSMQAVADAAARVDDLLKRTDGTVAGGAVLACYRESSLQLDELVTGELWTNLGGMYRLQIQQIS